MKSLLQGLAALLALVAAVCLLRVWQLPTPAPAGEPAPPLVLDADGAVQRFAAALRIPTISHQDRARFDAAAFEAFAAHLRQSFPRTHAVLTLEHVGPSLLYTWAGRDPAQPPVLLLAHMDVVPVEPGTESKWTHAPFGGEVVDGVIWGRGARDDKSSLLALLEAVEHQVAQGFQPPRTVMLAFGHDEEIGGEEGARRIAALLRERGVRAEFLLDEGSAVLRDLVPGVERPVAAIMTAEKGYVTMRLTARGEGGHSSQPPRPTAIGRLAAAVARVQATPMPARLGPPVTDMLEQLAPEMPFSQRLAIANRWLFAPLLVRALSAGRTTDPLVRTTTAPTVFHGGVKDNVVPTEAYALVNFRILPGDTRADVLRHVREAVRDERVAVEEEGTFGADPGEPASPDSASFRLLARTAREIFPDAVVSTGLVIGATDARHYDGTYGQRYNFSPSYLGPEDLPGIHGTDERISVDNYLAMVRFYVQLLRNLE